MVTKSVTQNTLKAKSSGLKLQKEGVGVYRESERDSKRQWKNE